MKNIIVVEISEGISRYPDLQDWVRFFDDDPNSPDFVACSFFEGDPDILRCDGYNQYFLAVDLNDTRYVLTSDIVTDSERLMLERFFSDDFQDSFTKGVQSLESFNQSDRSIAYRGGSGYVYTIWYYAA